MKVKKGMIRFFGIVGVVIFWLSAYYIGTFGVDISSYQRITLEVIEEAVFYGFLCLVAIGIVLFLCYSLYSYIVSTIEKWIKTSKGE